MKGEGLRDEETEEIVNPNQIIQQRKRIQLLIGSFCLNNKLKKQLKELLQHVSNSGDQHVSKQTLSPTRLTPYVYQNRILEEIKN